MDRTESFFALLHDARIAPHAAGHLPVWLFSADGKVILFANAVAAAILGSDTVTALLQRELPASDIAATQITRQVERLGPTLKFDAAPRLEKLRGLGAGFGRALLCGCSRISIGAQQGILVVALEPAGPNFALAERVRRLISGFDAPLAAFSPDGVLIHTNEAAQTLLSPGAALTDLRRDEVTIEHLGDGNSAFVLARLTGAKPSPAPEPQDVADLTPIAQALSMMEAKAEEERAAAAAESAPAAFAADAAPAEEAAPAASGITPAAPDEDAASLVPSALESDTPEPVETEASPVPDAPAQEHSADALDDDLKPQLRNPAPEAAQPPDAERRHHPLRFVWQMNAEGRFSLASGEFVDVIGPSIAASMGRPWAEIATELGLDPSGEVLRAIATRNTWSGITISWPVEGSDERLSVELSGLPIYDRDRLYRGYRGFGVCRDVTRIDNLMIKRFVRDPALDAQHENIVPFPNNNAENGNGRSATLTPGERTAFHEISSRLTERLKDADALATGRMPVKDDDKVAAGIPVAELGATAAAVVPASKPETDPLENERPLLDRLPVGVLIYRHSQFIYANAAFLTWTGHKTLAEFSQAGGLDTLFIETHADAADNGSGQSLRIADPAGMQTPVEARLFTVPHDGSTAMALVLVPAVENAAMAAAAKATEAELAETKSILDITADGILVADRSGHIVQANNRACAIFATSADAIAGTSLFDLFASDSARVVRDCLDWLAREGAPRMLSEGRDVIGKREADGPILLHMTMGRIGEHDPKFAVLIRDITSWKKSQEDLISAKRAAEKASSAKSEFLAKISHEIRTPLNAIIGFSEVMMSERFGAIGNDRYKDYLHDIHNSGEHVVSLLNDLLDLSKIEAGKLDLNFTTVDLNELMQQTVALMQPQAARERIILRQALAPHLPLIRADARSVRQIALNLLSNAVKFTGAGGQVIVSTTLSDRGDVILRVKDSGAGMSEKDIQTALEPFRQLPTSARYGSGGSGLGLPLTKALTEANDAEFTIKSAVNSGTLIEIVFAAKRD